MASAGTHPSSALNDSASVSLGPESVGLKFSLVLATIGRTDELSNFLEHLDRQSYRNFELIIVDQNPNDRLQPVLGPFVDRLTIKHLRSGKGLSRARNVGLQHVSGDVVTFPDDDCWYQSTTLQEVATMLSNHPEWAGVTGRCNAPRAFHFLDQNSGFLSKTNVLRRSTSVTIFLRSSAVEAAGDFDELLGAGADSGLASAEDADYVLRVLEHDTRIWYEPNLLIEHPDASPVYDGAASARGHAYGLGMGYMLRKHDFPLWYVGYMLLRAAGGGVL